MSQVKISYANDDDFIPGAPFFLRHTVMMNYGGKVYSVLKCIEMLADVDIGSFAYVVFFLYAICMTLGMYWYTRYWHLPQDIQAYYSNDKSQHTLLNFGQGLITLGAVIYYIIFAILFFICVGQTNLSGAISIGIWNVWCALNLLLAIDYGNF